MGSLTELQILSRARASSLENVKNLNFWGSDICDVSVLRKMPNVEVLSLSANGIFDLKDFAHCPRLRELYLRRNKIDDIKQIGYLKNLPRLRVLWLSDNPCAEDPNYRSTVLKTLPRLTKLDNIAVAPEDVNNAVTEGVEVETPDCIPCYPDVQETTSKTLLGSSVENGTELPDQSGKVTQDGGSPIKAKSLVDETNRLRAELGLKQLDLNGSSNHNITTVAIATTKPSFSTPSRPGRSASVESRNANILTAVLTLVKELDKACLLELKSEVDDLLQEFESNDEQTVSLTTAAAKDLLTG